jgi:hypothetical protein
MVKHGQSAVTERSVIGSIRRWCLFLPANLEQQFVDRSIKLRIMSGIRFAHLPFVQNVGEKGQ